jgi:putrescine aminotransferase
MSVDVTDNGKVLRTYRRNLSRGRARLAELTGGIVERSAFGTRVRDTTGREYLNCGGYGVFLLGHCHPAVTEAVIEQVRRSPLSTRLLLDPTAADAADALAEVTPAGLDKVHFVNSGAEATETAIKLARLHGKRSLVSATGGYHGKTTGALSLTANETYQAPFRPLLSDVTHVPFGDAAALEALLAQGHGDHCVVLEPIQGEAGVIIPPAGYLREVERICRAHDAFLVLDEIQTGLGRLGRWWGADRDGITPDVMLVGKNLSGGVVPVAAAVATAAAYAPLDSDPFLHTSTFAAAPIAMAAAATTVRTIAAEGLVTRAEELGRRLLTELRAILEARCPELVTEVRGAGLLLGIELADAHLAGDFVLELLEQGVLVNHSLNAHRVVRLTPAAVMNEADEAWLFEAVAGAADALAARHQPTHLLRPNRPAIERTA